MHVQEPTPFLESNALLAVQSGDEDHAKTLLEQMLPGERRSLRNACQRLASMINGMGFDLRNDR